MTCRTFFLLIFALLFVPSPGKASSPLDMPGTLQSRKVVGVLYFDNDRVELSKKHRNEIDLIASQVAVQFTPDKIVRVEAFSAQRDRQTVPLDLALLRAKAVWLHLEKKALFTASNLYLTGFSAQQPLSTLQGERVEIAIYDDPFKDSMETYSSR